MSTTSDLDRISTRQLNRLRRRILRVYGKARLEMTEQLTEFLEHYQKLDAYKRAQLEAGKITESDYRTWLRNQVFQSELMHQKLQNLQRLHWRQLVVLCEIVMLFVVGFFPQEWNLMANALVSFACAMQVQTFRKVNGYAFASTMCIGNMRSGMDSLCSWVLNRNPAALKKSLYYWGIILLFALGAGLGSLALDLCGAKAIWLSCLLLAVSFCLMFLKEDVEEIKEDLEALEAKH